MKELKIEKIVNLTPHPLNLMMDGEEIVIPPSGVIARAREERKLIEVISYAGREIPVYEVAYGEVENLPEPEAGVIYVVSSLAAQAVRRSQPHRRDVYVPGDPVRDHQGRIIGMRGLCKI